MMSRRPREQAADAQSAPPAPPAPVVEPSTDVVATEQDEQAADAQSVAALGVVATEADDVRDLDVERYVGDLTAYWSGGARPVMYLRADVVAARAADEQGEG
jgi:hypothetical protein